MVSTIFLINYVAAPFILSSGKDSIRSWKALGFYGHIMVFGGLTFFYMGGSQYLKGVQKQYGILPPSKGPAKSATNGTQTPIEEKNFISMPSVDKIVPPLQ